MNAVLSLWAWSEMAVVAVGGFFLHLPLTLVTRPFDPNRRISGRFFHSLALVVERFSPFWDFSVHGPIRKPGPKTIIVSNHESNADPFLITHLPWEMKWLAKESLFRVPFVGWSMRMAGDIPVKRGSHESARQALEKTREWVERGVPVVIFPEGTRSKTADLLPFKDGAFKVAIATGADILPIAVAGTRRALPKHSWRFARAKAVVTMGTPISTRGMTFDDLDRLKAEARAQIEALRREIQPLVAE